MTTPHRPRTARGRDQRGMATLAWLMIVAASAGMAALAVVVVQANVEEAGQAIADLNPRLSAAVHSAHAVELGAKLSPAEDFDTWSDWERHFHDRCALIAVVYSDVQAQVTANTFRRASGGTDFDTAASRHAADADASSPTAVKAQAVCTVE